MTNDEMGAAGRDQRYRELNDGWNGNGDGDGDGNDSFDLDIYTFMTIIIYHQLADHSTWTLYGLRIWRVQDLLVELDMQSLLQNPPIGRGKDRQWRGGFTVAIPRGTLVTSNVSGVLVSEVCVSSSFPG